MAKRPSNAIRFGCPRCQTRLFARPSQAGTKRRCPRCQFVFVVPTAEEAARRLAQREGTSEYTVSDKAGTRSEADTIPVVCSVCKTRMYATPEQIGQRIQCPDCDTWTTIPQPRPRVSPNTPFNPIDKTAEYRLWGMDQPPLDVKEVYQTYIPVICPCCHTRLHATLDQIGTQMVCPDCSTQITVVAGPKPPPKIDPMEGAEHDYTPTPPPPPRPEFEPIFEYSWGKDPQAQEPEPGRRRRRRHTQVAPTAMAMVRGIIGFLFYPEVLTRWLVFSGCQIVTVCFAAAALYLAAAGGILVLVGLLMYTLTGVLLLVSFAVAGATLIAIVVDTASGSERVENWPEGFLIDTDWFLDLIYLVSATAVSFLPAAGLAWLLHTRGVENLWIAMVSVFLVFPIVLMSMLERGSVMHAFSPSVWRSLVTSFWLWALFYAETAILIVASVTFSIFSLMTLGGIGLPFALLATTATVLLYFRLLGRLAFVCGQVGVTVDEDDSTNEGRQD